MVNAYTEFRRVEQELSLYGHISGMGERNGRERRERRTREMRNSAGAAAKRVRGSRNSVFNINLRPRLAERGRRIKLGILRKATRPHIRRIVIRPSRVLLSLRAVISNSLHSPSGILGSFHETPLVPKLLHAPVGITPVAGGRGQREGKRRECCRENIFFPPRNVFRRCHSAE